MKEAQSKEKNHFLIEKNKIIVDNVKLHQQFTMKKKYVQCLKAGSFLHGINDTIYNNKLNLSDHVSGFLIS